MTFSYGSFIPEYITTAQINELNAEKVCVEFLRVNSWIRKWFKTDYSGYTIKQGGYEHLPLERKLELIAGLDVPQATVCEDEDEAYQYWKTSFNSNPEDCCNLRR